MKFCCIGQEQATGTDCKRGPMHMFHCRREVGRTDLQRRGQVLKATEPAGAGLAPAPRYVGSCGPGRLLLRHGLDGCLSQLAGWLLQVMPSLRLYHALICFAACWEAVSAPRAQGVTSWGLANLSPAHFRCSGNCCRVLRVCRATVKRLPQVADSQGVECRPIRQPNTAFPGWRWAKDSSAVR